MKILIKFIDICPYIIASCSLLIVFSMYFSMKSKKNREKTYKYDSKKSRGNIISEMMGTDNKILIWIVRIAIYISGIYIFALFGIIFPYAMISVLSTELFYNSSILTIMALISFVWIAIELFIKFRNKLIILNNNEKEIYIRDIEVEYSPAVLYFLIHNKLETNVILPATILNLCAKKVIKLKENNEGKIDIVDLNDTKTVNELSSDEKYAYKMLTTDITSSKIIEWKNKIKNEYDKYKFSKKHTVSLGAYLLCTYILLIVILIILSIIMGRDTLDKFWGYLAFMIFFASWITIIWSTAINSILNRILKTNKITNFKDTYTKKGAIEFNKWNKFKKFIKEFSLIKEKDYESIVVLGKYLSYSIALGVNKNCDKELLQKINIEYFFDFDKVLKNLSIDLS